MKKAKGILRGIQAFMDSARGKTILNYLYSWGAAVVILGTLFKLTHMAGANLMLFVGMGTEVLVFFFSAFERPYEIAEEEKREEAVATGLYAAGGQPVIINGPIVAGGVMPQAVAATGEQPVEGEEGYGTEDAESTPAAVPVATSVATSVAAPVTSPAVIGGGAAPAMANASYAPASFPVASAESIDEMGKVTEEYIEQVRALNEAIQRISQQTEALGKSMEEMDTLGRNLTGVNAIYEVQLRSAGGQLGAIDQVNEQTKKMAQQIEELNSIYARMIEAMTSNMNRPQI